MDKLRQKSFYFARILWLGDTLNDSEINLKQLESIKNKSVFYTWN